MRKEVTKRLGTQWKRRLKAAKYTLIDAEGILKDQGCPDSSLADVCEALRNAIDAGERDQ